MTSCKPCKRQYMAGKNLIVVLYLATFSVGWAGAQDSYCESTPVVKLCQDSSAIGSTVFLDLGGVPRQQKFNCSCILSLYAENTDNFSVIALKEDPGHLKMTVDDRPVNVSEMVSNMFTYSRPVGITVYQNTEMKQSHVQCFKIQGMMAMADLNVTCFPAGRLPGTSTVAITTASSVMTSSVTNYAGSSSSASDNTGESIMRKTTSEHKKQVPDVDRLDNEDAAQTLENGNSDRQRIGIIAGTVGAALVLVAVVVVVTVVICRRRRRNNKSEDRVDSKDNAKDVDYDIIVNASYISADECRKDEDPSGRNKSTGNAPDIVTYSVVHKRSKTSPASATNNESNDNEYNRLHEKFYKPKLDNVYNAAGASVGELPEDLVGNYSHVDDIQKWNVSDNVYDMVDETEKKDIRP